MRFFLFEIIFFLCYLPLHISHEYQRYSCKSNAAPLKYSLKRLPQQESVIFETPGGGGVEEEGDLSQFFLFGYEPLAS